MTLEMILQMHWAESILRVQSIGVYGPYNVKNANVVDVDFFEGNLSYLEKSISFSC